VFNISATELLVIAVVALLVLGPDKLPDAMRKLGRATRELKRLSSGFEAELRDALSDPVEAPQQPAPSQSSTPAQTAAAEAGTAPPAVVQPANPTAVPEPAIAPELPGEQPSSGETAA
jgi:sec-independent protein translocase protein TatB